MKRKQLMEAFERPSTTTVSDLQYKALKSNHMTFTLIFHIHTLISELVLKRNLFVNESRTAQLDYLVNDTTYPGLEGTVLLHFNVTILPVQIRFANTTQMFTLTRRASVYAQVLTRQIHNFLFSLLLSGVCPSQS